MISKKELRVYDLFLSICMIVILSPIILLTFFICLIDSGNPIFVQKRVGKNLKPFYLLKFRTLKVNTPSKATHLISKSSLTKFGMFIRLFKLDELPQLINVIKGEMSLVGPRPCLYNQEKLINERIKNNVFDIKPGITGLAQINGIDMSTPAKLAKADKKMISQLTTQKYFRYLFLTLFGKGLGDKIKN